MIETKISSGHVYAYLLNKKLKPASNKGIRCQIKFHYYNRGSIDLHLHAYREDGFIAKADVDGYHFYRVTFYVFGKSISTTFMNENEDLIVKQ